MLKGLLYHLQPTGSQLAKIMKLWLLEAHMQLSSTRTFDVLRWYQNTTRTRSICYIVEVLRDDSKGVVIQAMTYIVYGSSQSEYLQDISEVRVLEIGEICSVGVLLVNFVSHSSGCFISLLVATDQQQPQCDSQSHLGNRAS